MPDAHIKMHMRKVRQVLGVKSDWNTPGRPPFASSNFKARRGDEKGKLKKRKRFAAADRVSDGSLIVIRSDLAEHVTEPPAALALPIC